MSTAIGHPASSSRTITVWLGDNAPCEHDWTAEEGYVYCHECGVGAPRSVSFPPPAEARADR